MRYKICLVRCWLTAAATCLASANADAQSFTSRQGVAWIEESFIDQRNTGQSYFISPGARSDRLIVLLQGSGCVPLFTNYKGDLNTSVAGQDDLVRIASGATVMVIEKPGLARNDPIGAKPGRSDDCPAAFRARYNLDDWTQVVERAIADHARRVPGGVTKTALIGISEGSDTVARLSARGIRGPVASIGGGCTGTMSSLLASAVAREREKREGPSVDEVEKTLADIRAHPDAWDRFAFGHTYMRYASFGAQCDTQGLARHPDNVFIAYGTMDNTDVLGLESMAELRNREGLPVRLIRVHGGDHGLQVGSEDHLTPTMRAFLEWSFAENAK